jgi:hypothetical protein
MLKATYHTHITATAAQYSTKYKVNNVVSKPHKFFKNLLQLSISSNSCLQLSCHARSNPLLTAHSPRNVHSHIAKDVQKNSAMKLQRFGVKTAKHNPETSRLTVLFATKQPADNRPGLLQNMPNHTAYKHSTVSAHVE